MGGSGRKNRTVYNSLLKDGGMTPMMPWRTLKLILPAIPHSEERPQQDSYEDMHGYQRCTNTYRGEYGPDGKRCTGNVKWVTLYRQDGRPYDYLMEACNNIDCPGRDE